MWVRTTPRMPTWTALMLATLALSRASSSLVGGMLRAPLPQPLLSQLPRRLTTAAIRLDVSAETCDLDGLRKEAQRKLYRAQKKASKAEERALKCEAKQEALLNDENASLEDLEALPPCDELRAAAEEEAERMEELARLVSGLQAVTSGGAVDAADAQLSELLRLAATLGVEDTPPARPPPPPPKKKGPRASTAPRLPYRVFRSEGGVEIRVGKQAKDNDVLSTDPAHRDNDDWWLHASGCPGSHVVIRHETVSGSSLPREVELDAAVLAANYSKAAKSGTVPVNICKARQVSKPAGAKPGLVQLSGDVKTIKVSWKNEKRRLDRLASDGDGEEEAASPS